MNKQGMFQIKFVDGENFIGNLFEKDWGKIPEEKRILEIVFSLGDKPVKMIGFSEYNLTFETHVLIGKGSRIVNATLAGRAKDKSVLLIYDCLKAKIVRKEVKPYEEYQWISSTWKQGIKDGTPKDYHG